MAYDIVCVLAVCVFEYSKHGGTEHILDKNLLFMISNQTYNAEVREG